MPPNACLVPSGSARVFEIAGIPIQFRCELDGDVALSLSETYSLFATDETPSVEIRVLSSERLDPSTAPPLRSAVHWTLFGSSDEAVFEFRHVPTSQIYCRATLRRKECLAEVVFAEATWREHGGTQAERGLPFPLEQLLVLPLLALEDGLLLHAGGALLSGRAFAYAGHSGDGKTTLSGLLAQEDVELLSDERIAVRKVRGDFVAYGTPWSGQGNVASASRGPLGQLFLLRKSDRHALSEPRLALVPELVSRAIVPYYFQDVAEEILRLFSELSRRVPVRELRFARSPGLRALLSSEDSFAESLTRKVASS